MKKRGFKGLILALLLLVSGLIMSNCDSDAFWTGFDAGYNATRGYDSGSIFDREVIVNP